MNQASASAAIAKSPKPTNAATPIVRPAFSITVSAARQIERNAIAALDCKADVVENQLLAAVGRGVNLRQILGLNDSATRGRRLGNREVNRRLFFGDLDTLDLL